MYIIKVNTGHMTCVGALVGIEEAAYYIEWQIWPLKESIPSCDLPLALTTHLRTSDNVFPGV